MIKKIKLLALASAFVGISGAAMQAEAARPLSALSSGGSIGGYNLKAPGNYASFNRGFRRNTRIYVQGQGGSVALTGKVNSAQGSISCSGSSCYVSTPYGDNYNVSVQIKVTNTGFGAAKGSIRYSN